jgi:SAM-dependent methyltransferase
MLVSLPAGSQDAHAGAVWDSARVADYLDVNRANWDDRVPAHLASADYAVRRFTEDPGFISGVVRFDLPLLGDVAGLRAVHLQCHIGTDTVSLARLGASMTGLDFSGPAYAAAEALEPGSFDLVYTGIGALCWLPSARRWAQVVAALLRPGGRLFIRDGHPMLFTMEDPRDDGLLVVRYPYFEQAGPQVFDEPGTYVDSDAVFEHNVSHEWNHGIGEVVTALLDAGMTLTGLAEHDSVPWNALPGMMTEAGGEWRLTDGPSRVACSFTIQAVK